MDEKTRDCHDDHISVFLRRLPWPYALVLPLVLPIHQPPVSGPLTPFPESPASPANDIPPAEAA